VSHDLGAPIRHVIGFSDLLREQYGGLLDRVGKNSLERISGAGHRMESMLHALVDLHRISTTPVAADRLNLSGMARSVAQEIKQGHADSRVTIDIQDGLVCRADRALMRMVLWNLLNNAVKFSAKSAHSRVSLRQVEQDGMTAFMVSDNGVGFDPQSADQLFRPFARLHASADYPGTGVGLATVQRIIRSHGGQIWAESEPGNGARFMFTLWENGAAIPSAPVPPAQ
jgi:light-regulated signal transduction histidine kinase (bacteriophytochrome)